MVNMAYMLSEGVDRREAIPIAPKASHDTGYTVYLPPMIREVTTCNSEMLQWPLALWLAWLCVTFCVNSKYCELKRKIKVAGQTWGRKILQLYTLNTEFHQHIFFNCYGVTTFFTFLGNFIFNIVLPAIFITQLAQYA